jgi:DNA polymerase III subunit epsilon
MSPLNNLLILDLETTGLDRNANFVIEIGAIRITNHRPVASLSTVVNFGGILPGSIPGLTGIHQEDVDAGCEKDYAFRALRGLMYPPCVVVCHNAAFDISFLYREMVERMKLEGVTPISFLCTMTVAAALFPNEPGGYSLAAMCQKFGIVQTAAHRAMPDARACYSLLRKLQEVAPLDQYINIMGHNGKYPAPSWVPEWATLKAF